MRDDAIAFVQKGYADKQWIVWADCHKLIDEQDGVRDATPEGMEAFGFDLHGKNDEHDDTDGEDGDSEDGDGGGPDETFGGGHDEPHGPDVGDDYDEGDDGSEGGDGPGGGTGGVIAIADEAVAEFSSAAGSGALPIRNGEAPAHAPYPNVAAAHLTLYNEAIREGDDTFLRQIRKKIRGHNRAETDAITKAGILLKQTADEDAAADAKRRKVNAEKQRLEAKDSDIINANKFADARATAEARERAVIAKVNHTRNERVLKLEALQQKNSCDGCKLNIQCCSREG